MVRRVLKHVGLGMALAGRSVSVVVPVFAVTELETSICLPSQPKLSRNNFSIIIIGINQFCNYCKVLCIELEKEHKKIANIIVSGNYFVIISARMVYSGSFWSGFWPRSSTWEILRPLGRYFLLMVGLCCFRHLAWSSLLTVPPVQKVGLVFSAYGSDLSAPKSGDSLRLLRRFLPLPRKIERFLRPKMRDFLASKNR